MFRCVVFAFRSAIYCLLLITDNIIATGDDDGTLKVDSLCWRVNTSVNLAVHSTDNAEH